MSGVGSRPDLRCTVAAWDAGGGQRRYKAHESEQLLTQAKGSGGNRRPPEGVASRCGSGSGPGGFGRGSGPVLGLGGFGFGRGSGFCSSCSGGGGMAALP